MIDIHNGGWKPTTMIMLRRLECWMRNCGIVELSSGETIELGTTFKYLHEFFHETGLSRNISFISHSYVFWESRLYIFDR